MIKTIIETIKKEALQFQTEIYTKYEMNYGNTDRMRNNLDIYQTIEETSNLLIRLKKFELEHEKLLKDIEEYKYSQSDTQKRIINIKHNTNYNNFMIIQKDNYDFINDMKAEPHINIKDIYEELGITQRFIENIYRDMMLTIK